MTGPGPQTAASDKDVLHRFGYAQQLLRDMGGFSNFAISFSIISILTGAVTLYGVGLNAGGPVVMGIGWPLVTLFVLFVAASLAELASAIPTSGALYHWASFLGGPTLGWMTAWLNLIGLIAAIAGIDYGCAQFMVPLLGLPETSGNFMLVFGMRLTQLRYAMAEGHFVDFTLGHQGKVPRHLMNENKKLLLYSSSSLSPSPWPIFFRPKSRLRPKT